MFQSIKNILPFAKKISLVVLFLEFDRPKLGHSDEVFETLQRYLSKIDNCHITYLRIDNKYEHEKLQKIAQDVYATGGDNHFREFSGWQKGLTALNTLKIPCDLVLITNEMFLKPGPCYLQDYADIALLKRSLQENKIIGRLDSTKQEYTLFGYDVTVWVCTNCFFVPKKALDKLGSFIHIDDTIDEILPATYPSEHLVTSFRLQRNDLKEGHFSLQLRLPQAEQLELRFSADKSFSPTNRNQKPNSKPFSFCLKKILQGNTPLPRENIIRGTLWKNNARWAEQTFLLQLGNTRTAKSELVIEGFVPPEIFADTYQNELTISIFHDNLLFHENAPINTNYKRWLVEWLTERWHSRFTIDKETWQLFRTKSAAIFNEALLTAKFKELGYTSESYGDKKYY